MTMIRAWLSPTLWGRVLRLLRPHGQQRQQDDRYASKMLNWRLEQDLRRGDWQGWR